MKSVRNWASVIVVVAIATLATNVASAAPSTVPGFHNRRPLPDRLWGVTLDNTADINRTKLDDEAASLLALPTMPITRIVMDVATLPSDYDTAVTALQPDSYLMAELGDSSEMKRETVAAYGHFEQSLVTAFADRVDLWEIGNEVNGEWVGSTADEVAKISQSFASVNAIGGRSELTLYFNPNCWSKPANEMFTWARANVPDSMKAGLDDVLISYYPNDCNGYWPTRAGWQSVFDRLHAMFPNAKLGFGESGISTDKGSAAAKAALLRRYYTLRITGDNYVGGYFWWYYAEDAVPYQHNAVWNSLRASVAGRQ
jgi:hypothetical protein